MRQNQYHTALVARGLQLLTRAVVRYFDFLRSMPRAAKVRLSKAVLKDALLNAEIFATL
jgi:hypothetical protein